MPGRERSVQEVGFARRDGLPREVELLDLGRLLAPPHDERTTRPSRTHFHTVMLVEQGRSRHHVDFEPWRVGPGDLVVVPQGCVQAFDPARVIRGRMVLFTAGFLERSQIGSARVEAAARPLLRHALRAHLGAEACRVLQAPLRALEAASAGPSDRDAFWTDAVEAAFALLLFVVAGRPEVADALAARVPEDPLVARFLDRLEADFRFERRAAHYARALRVSTSTLDRHVRAARGRTARQAIADRVVLEAKRLLLRPDTSIKTVAFELGFSEPQNFTRFFGTQTGLAPQRFRDAPR